MSASAASLPGMPPNFLAPYPGAVYHVMARGDGGRAIFIAKEDHQLFLHGLSPVCGSHGCWVHAWLLMGNHFDLLLERPEPAIPDLPHHFLTHRKFLFEILEGLPSRKSSKAWLKFSHRPPSRTPMIVAGRTSDSHLFLKNPGNYSRC